LTQNNKVVFATEFFTIEEIESGDEFSTNPYFRLVSPDSSIACIFDSSSRVLLVRQFRPTLGEYTLEFPAGGIDTGEDANVAAQRETLEETGFDVELAAIGNSYHLLINRTGSKMHLFCGRAREANPIKNPEPGVELVWVSRAELLSYSLDGRYKQLGGLGLLQILGGVLGLDIWTCSNENLQFALDGLFAKNATNDV
jgi:8-oxo-dGTP pyrophosphatase MutT (NUDIX family)